MGVSGGRERRVKSGLAAQLVVCLQAAVRDCARDIVPFIVAEFQALAGETRKKTGTLVIKWLVIEPVVQHKLLERRCRLWVANSLESLYF